MILLVTWLVSAAAAPGTGVTRYALVAGTNDGGPSRSTLRYAQTDAKAFGQLLNELGGVQRENAQLLLGAGKAALLDGLSALRARVQGQEPGTRAQLVFYYSGHSDETGLLLRGERFAYEELRRELAAFPAEVRIAVIDSCASGALTRRKGGVRRPPFLLDSSRQLQGHAFLTSSAGDEAAQESEKIEASFFTHALISGLRGAADASRDGLVTLSEAYQFAFNETLDRTEKTRAGPQHPGVEIDLVGTGDLVLTDMRAATAGLALAEDVSGRISVRDSSARLVVELRKQPKDVVEVWVPPGQYRVRLMDGASAQEAQVTVAPSQRSSVTAALFHPVALEFTASRGVSPARATFPRGLGTVERGAAPRAQLQRERRGRGHQRRAGVPALGQDRPHHRPGRGAAGLGGHPAGHRAASRGGVQPLRHGSRCTGGPCVEPAAPGPWRRSGRPWPSTGRRALRRTGLLHAQPHPPDERGPALVGQRRRGPGGRSGWTGERRPEGAASSWGW